MQDTIDAQLDDVDLAVAAYRRAGEWVVDELTLEHCEDVDGSLPEASHVDFPTLSFLQEHEFRGI